MENLKVRVNSTFGPKQPGQNVGMVPESSFVQGGAAGGGLELEGADGSKRRG